MTSWIYVFSKFTPEALLFEALAIFLLIAGYAAFWVLRKRRLGAAAQLVPASVVKLYLNELIGDANEMRAQLFGLLNGDTLPVPGTLKTPVATLKGLSGADAQKLAALEAKMAEQAAAIEKIMAEKAKLEKELSDARAAGGNGGQTGDLQKLQEKCQGLEARLAEYSVIEDDLANLKRLQQENAQLKAQFGGPGGASQAAAAPAPTAAPTPAPAVIPEVLAAAVPPAPDEAAPSPESAAVVPETSFEGLVDEVEKSLDQPTAPAEAPVPAETLEAEPATPASQPNPPAAAVEKSDEDLIAEFEKMLSS